MNGVANLSLSAQSTVGQIAFIDLKAQQRRIRGAVEQRLQAVLDHGRYIAGPEIEELEKTLAARTGAGAVVACASGTDALIIPLLAKGLGAGDAVFIPAFTYNATANAVLLAGATPVFVDINPDTFNIDPESLERCIAETRSEGALTPRAVIPVDLFGAPADYRRIHAIAEKENLFVLADAAQSYGGKLDNKRVGNLAPMTGTSFFPGKALGAYGDAGAIFAEDAHDAECLESIRWHGTDSARKESIRVGFNGRMDSFQAAVLLEKLSIFDDELEARKQIAATYKERLGGMAKLQQTIDGAASGLAYFCLCIENRDEVVAKINSYGVPTAIYYTTPLHRMSAFAPYAPAKGLPATEALSQSIFALPFHPYMTPEQINYVCDAVEAAVTA